MDVLVAVVILGIAITAIYQALITGFWATERARDRQWALLYGASKVVEVDLGIERATSGTIEFPSAAQRGSWQTDLHMQSSTFGPVLEVRWGGKTDEYDTFLYGFTNPTYVHQGFRLR